MAKSLKKCIATLTASGELSVDLATEIQDAVTTLVSEGYTAKDASIAAVNDALDELKSELTGIYKQIGLDAYGNAVNEPDSAGDVDLGQLFDEVLAEETATPTKSDADFKKEMGAAAFRNEVKRQPPYHLSPEQQRNWLKGWDAANVAAPVERTPGQAVTSAVKNTAAGLADAIDGLSKLFGSNGSRLSSGLTFDEETYKKAKPLFVQAIAHFKDAGKDLKEAMRAIVKMVLDKFGPQVTENMKPYIVRFMEDVKAGNVVYDESKETGDENNGIRQSTDGTGSDGKREGSGSAAPYGRSDEGLSQAGDGAQDRGAGTGRAGRGESLEPMAQEDEGTGKGREADRGDRARGEGLDEGQGVRGTEQLGGRDRDAPDVRDRPSGPAADAQLEASTKKAPSIEGVSVSGAADFQISSDDAIGEGGQKTKARNNIAAIRLLKKLEAEDRAATPQEQKILAKYVGWGGIKQVFDDAKTDWTKERNDLKSLLSAEEYAAARRSMLDAHYTSTDVVSGMWAAAKHLGFTGGRVLEPSVGVGNFFGMMPADLRAKSELFGVELDNITALLAKNLYPSATIAQMGFQDVELPTGAFDFAIGNPPFGDQTLFDKNHTDLRSFNIHQFFFAKTLDKLRPGGVMQLVVSRYLMDSRDAAGHAAREYLGQRAKLLGAIRLPYNAFLGNANTEVVTDIIYLQKLQEGETPNPEAWSDTADVSTTHPKTGEQFSFPINQYFIDHPDMVLGTHAPTGKMRQANQYNVEPIEGESLLEGIGRAIGNLPQGVMKAATAPLTELVTKASEVPEGTKVFGYYMAGGKVMQRTNDVMGNRQGSPVEFANDKAPLRAAGMIEIRDQLRQLMRAELSDATDAELVRLRARLNSTYDAYQKKFGYINQPANRRSFRDDPDLPLLESLEPAFDPGLGAEAAKKRGESMRKPGAKKADIFTKRVLAPYHEITSVNSAQDALIASLNARGGVDQEYMAELYGRPWDEIRAELGNLVFHNPNGGWETSDAYLSGNVKAKYKVAEAAAEIDPKYIENVEALRAVIPPDVPALKISVRLGSPWVPADVMGKFASDLWGAKDPAIKYIKQVAKWTVKADSGDETARKTTWGVTYQSLRGSSVVFGADSVLEFVANTKAISIRENVGSSEQPVWRVNEPATEAIRAKAQEMREKFREWIWQDEERRDRLAKIYNETYNTDRRREYDGSHLTLPGASQAISLRRHQKDAVWRAIQERTILLDHAVGAGKTFEMAAISMELRRLGITRKPMFAVPNSLVRQWRDEFYRLYPNANVLAATEADFTKANRKRFMAKIATGDWDAVIVAHSSFKKIGMPPETEREILNEQLKEMADAIEELKRGRGDKAIVRDMEKIKIKLEERMKALKESGGKKDDTVSFDELGVDGLFVDEAHNFKNLFFYSQMRNVTGMGNPAGSGRAFDLFVKTQYLSKRHAGKALMGFATGTPVSNSLVEMFTMQRYLAWNKLKENGLHLLDAWAGVYGDVQQVYEVHPSGTGYRLSTRFAKFVNLPSLMDLYRGFADVITMDDLKRQAIEGGGVFPVPKIKGGRPRNIVAERSDLQTRFFGEPEFGHEGDAIKFKYLANLTVKKSDKDGKWHPWLPGGSMVGGEGFDTEAEAIAERDTLIRLPEMGWNAGSILHQFENLKELTKQSKGKINALSITNQARKAGLDYRLIDPNAPDFPGSKINIAIDEITRIYKAWSKDKGAQLVFCDLSVPKSARAAAAAKERDAYVRNEDGGLEKVKATITTIKGVERSFLVVKRGRKDAWRFMVYDGATGVDLEIEADTRAEANKALAEALETDLSLQDKFEQYSEIEESDIADYKDAQGVEEDDAEEDDSINVSELMALAGGNAFSVYDDIRTKLIGTGILANEIAFIHDYDTAAKKNDLFGKVKSGEIRVLLGSTEKMGAGMNVQERLVALHHLDAPWRPSDLEQREGRIVRQGNELYKRDPDGFEVEVFRYGTRQTYDTRMWQIIEHKAAGVEQLRKAGADLLEIDDVGGEAANAADMKAAASGNPLILDEIKLRNEAKSLEAQQFAYIQGKANLQDKVRWYKAAPDRAEKRIAEIQPIIDKAKSNPAEPFSFIIDGKTYDKLKDIATPLTVAFTESAKGVLGQKESAGEYRGFPLQFRKGPYGIMALVGVGDKTIPVAEYGIEDKFSPSGLITRIDNALDRVSKEVEDIRVKTAESVDQIPKLEAEIAKPFAKEADLKEVRAKHRAVVSKLQKAGGGIELTTAMKKELDAALRERLGAAVFSRTDAAVPDSRQLSAAQLLDIAEQAFSQLGHQPKLLIEDSAVGVTGRADDVGRVSGMVSGGRVYLFRDGIKDTGDALRVIWHELLHYGIRRFLTADQYIDQMGELASRDPLLKMQANAWVKNSKDAAKAREYAQGRDELKNRVEAYVFARGVDEALARFAETIGPNNREYANNSVHKRMLRNIRAWLADLADSLSFGNVASWLRSMDNKDAREYVHNIFGMLRTNAAATQDDVMFTADGAFSSSASIPNSAQQPINLPGGQAVGAPIPNNAQVNLGVQGGQTGAAANWNLSDDSWFAQKIYKFQNKYVDLKDTIKAIEGAGQQIRDTFDPYLQEELYHKRVGKRSSDFFEDEFKPLLEQMRKDKVSREDFEEYLHARHAKEANQLIRDRGGMADGGSGMTDQEADDYRTNLDPAKRSVYAALAARVDAINAKTRATLVHYGLESRETTDSWAKMFVHYVPLHREDMAEGRGIGQGFSVKGPASKHRTGSSRKVADILANIAEQRDRAIVRGEKNRVAVALYGLAVTNPNTDIWQADKAPAKQTLDKNGQIVTAIDPMYKSRPNVVVARIKGKDGRVHDRAVVFNEENERAVRMAEALKNLDAPHLEGLIGIFSKITRYISAMSTQYNPVFVAVNFTRDFQTVALNLSSTPLAGKQVEVSMHALSALRGIYSDLRAHRAGKQALSKWAQLYEEMQLEGGTTGYREMFANANERSAEQIEKLLDPEWWAKTGWGKAVSVGGILRAPEQWLVSKPGAAAMNWLSDMNETAENAMRLAVYKTAIDMGISKQRAASLAKNISVNFNRKGQVGAKMNALYAFFNAAVQGTARMAETMTGPRGRQIMLGGVLLGVMQALAMAWAGFDDDDPPDFVRERSLIIPIGEKRYITVPMPLGFHVIPNLGRIPAEFAIRGFKNPGKYAVRLIGLMLEAFNPIGGGASLAQLISFTPTDPLVAIWENKDWTGKPIYRENFSENKPTPGFTRAKDTASVFSKWVAEALNKVSGGSEYSPGWASPTPDQIDYLVGQATGGVGREALKAWQLGESAVTGEEMPTYKIPLVGRFYGKAEGQHHEASKFYENLREYSTHKAEIVGRRKDGISAQEYVSEHPEARLYKDAEKAERQVAFLRRQKRKMMERGAPREEIKLHEKRITDAMARFNQKAEAVEQ